MKRYFEENSVDTLLQFRFYAYFYSAQSDAACEEPQVQEEVSAAIVHLFFPTQAAPQLSEQAEDIFSFYQARFREENQARGFPLRCGYSTPSARNIARWLPWYPPLPWAPPPPTEWTEQIDQLKAIQHALTPQQTEAVFKWAGKGKGYNWHQLITRHIEKQGVDPAKALLAKSVLMQALYDGAIAEIRDKYTYCVPRPGKMDPSFKPLLVIDSPSYPSGHAIDSTIFACIMTYFFPRERQHWHALAREAAASRLWGGVHFPVDIVQGKILGQKIAQNTLKGYLRALHIFHERARVRARARKQMIGLALGKKTFLEEHQQT